MHPKLFTVGYSHTTQQALIDCLTGAGVQLLADIRYLPLSRRPGFSKNSLKAAVEQAGMAYSHFKYLGTPKEGREAARHGDYAGLRRVYLGELELPEAHAQMAQLLSLALEQAVCLLCVCEERSKCHRGVLVEELFGDFEVVDLKPQLLAS